MKILVTNLQDQTKRREFMTGQLDKLKVDYELIYCIDGRKWDNDYIKSITSEKLFGLYTKYSDSWLTKGAIAATLTHVKILYQRLIDENIDYLLLMEDDVKLADDFTKDTLDQIQNTLRNSALKGIFLLHSTSNETQHLVAESKIKVNAKYAFYRPEKINMGSGAAYIIDKDTAASLIKAQTPVDNIADWWNDHYQNKSVPEVYVMYPPPAATDVFESTLGYIQPNSFNWFLKKYLLSNFISKWILNLNRKIRTIKNNKFVIR